ncbi:MAG: glycerol-3-phosphate dehydrogenase [Burkholderiales bacterium]
MKEQFDVLIVGGGINGAGIARDASGRGLKVALCERGDFGGETSSASSKLIHGGLRYLETNQFRLVRESLREREVLLRVAGHLVKPLRFVLPHQPDLRPAWMIRIGLWIYDTLGGGRTLPGSRRENLRRPPFVGELLPQYHTGFSYSDCQVDDARLVIANLIAAKRDGARILPRTACVALSPEQGLWRARLRTLAGEESELQARTVVNATGPWVKQFIDEIALLPGQTEVRLVKGSHIVVPRKIVGDHAYIVQNHDRRIVFLIPFEEKFTLIGTTESVLAMPASGIGVTEQESHYLIEAANRYLAHPVRPEEIVWRYAGVRALYDDGRDNPSDVTRDYFLLRQSAANGAPLLSVFGGKITTYRKLAEHVVDKLELSTSDRNRPWTAAAPLPGSDCLRSSGELAQGLIRKFALLPVEAIEGIVRRHGTLAHDVLDGANSAQGLGRHFGAGLTEGEIDYFIEQEWASTADDILWRRSKIGLHLDAAQRAGVESYVKTRTPRA